MSIFNWLQLGRKSFLLSARNEHFCVIQLFINIIVGCICLAYSQLDYYPWYHLGIPHMVPRVLSQRIPEHRIRNKPWLLLGVVPQQNNSNKTRKWSFCFYLLVTLIYQHQEIISNSFIELETEVQEAGKTCLRPDLAYGSVGTTNSYLL